MKYNSRHLQNVDKHLLISKSLYPIPQSSKGTHIHRITGTKTAYGLQAQHFLLGVQVTLLTQTLCEREEL